MLTFDSCWRGVLMGIGPCCFAKIISGFFLGKDRWVTGFAMVGRGEFAFLVAEIALHTELPSAAQRLLMVEGVIHAEDHPHLRDAVTRPQTVLSESGYAIVVWALLVAA